MLSRLYKLVHYPNKDIHTPEFHTGLSSCFHDNSGVVPIWHIALVVAVDIRRTSHLLCLHFRLFCMNYTQSQHPDFHLQWCLNCGCDLKQTASCRDIVTQTVHQRIISIILISMLISYYTRIAFNSHVSIHNIPYTIHWISTNEIMLSFRYIQWNPFIKATPRWWHFKRSGFSWEVKLT